MPDPKAVKFVPFGVFCPEWHWPPILCFKFVWNLDRAPSFFGAPIFVRTLHIFCTPLTFFNACLDGTM